MSQAIVSDDPVNPVDISSPSLKRSAEAAATLNQLKQLVPSLRSRRNASDDLEFLQHIIDYIHHLQKQLNLDNNVKSQQPNSGVASQNH
ncbi:hypothetical protein D917_00333 [Trichinella nativa]|uniref:DNA-binding protein inhibitor ID-1 n=1 Tax=Trichinella nativa TaxID=6335 RepID=A0A1Y3EF30_9BILA|nr:hypothetical protein D917_00333 [Trichinella nativa]